MNSASAETITDKHAAGFVPARIAAGWGVGTLATTTMLNGMSVVLLYFLVTVV